MNKTFSDINSIVKELLKIDDEDKRKRISGFWGSSIPFFASLLLKDNDRSLLLICSSPKKGETYFKDLSFFLKLNNIPMEHHLLSFEDSRINQSLFGKDDFVQSRLNLLYGLMNGKRTALISTLEAINDPVVKKDLLRKRIINLITYEIIDLHELTGNLVDMGYTRRGMVERVGDFSIRGGIIDIYTATKENPLRIELSDDIIESIRLFDLSSQRSIEKIDSAVIIPSDEDNKEDGESIINYLPEDTILLLDDYTSPHPPSIVGRESGKSSDEIMKSDKFSVIFDIQSIGIASRDNKSNFDFKSLMSIGFSSTPNTFSFIIDKLNNLREKGKTIIVVRNSEHVGKMVQLLSEHDVPAEPLKDLNKEEAEGIRPVYIAVGELSSGFLFESAGIYFLTENDIFGKETKIYSPTTQKKSVFLSSFNDLKINDYVVHVNYGIGQYVNLTKIAIDRFESDYMVIRFLGDNKLYVPVDRLDLVQKYSGVEGVAPALDKLGGTSWEKRKESVKKKIREMTKELVDLYAARKIVQGIRYSGDSHFSREFDAYFEFEETEDQWRAIEDVKRDMESDVPMDRLVCGDVGYGKTEVALRSAFKAVMDNKQVAVLVPTTLLAFQHYRTFVKRFTPFPVKVGMLSRLTPKTDQKKIVQEMKEGKVDIVIGTHRLVHKGIEFRDLGLLIIDEEHRFGVAHKEKLKKIKTNIDVLTLTATPIPRTLQMSYSGIRDLSIIATPPPDRKAINTMVIRFDRDIIREAIHNELSRDGQIFFIHNRIDGIEGIARLIRDICPELKIGLIHGRMRESQMEEVLLKFINKEYNLLLSTSIIESGLDIPTANTIIINRADMFGLAELYQLRGRVGRSGEQAFAYLLVPDNDGLTNDARSRLQAIQEFSELGAGFRIAARDMEIRGAGNLLGGEQSGHIEAIGLDLYLQMIEDAVRENKGEVKEEEIEPLINLKNSAYIPDEYIPDTYQRLSFYKRLSSLRIEKDINLIREELVDRYGQIPEPTENLLNIIDIKIMAIRLKIVRIELNDKGVMFDFHKDSQIGEDVLNYFIKNKCQFISEYSILISLPKNCSPDYEVRKYLQTMIQYDVMTMVN